MNFKAKSELLVLVFRINVISNFWCRSLCMDFLPPSGGVFQLSLVRSLRRVSHADGHVIFKVQLVSCW